MTQTIKHCIEECPKWKESRRKYDIHGNMEELLGKSCEVQKLRKFINAVGFLKYILERDEEDGSKEYWMEMSAIKEAVCYNHMDWKS